MYVEDDLRTALSALAHDTEPDVTSVREWIEGAVDGSNLGLPHRTTANRFRTVFAAAACVAVVIAAAIALSSAHKTTKTPTGVHVDPKPLVVLGSLLYPGTTVLQTYRGDDSQTLHLAHYKPIQGREFSILVTCDPRATFTGTQFAPDCQPAPGVGTLPGTYAETVAQVPTTISVDVKDHFKWALALVSQPEVGSNASLQSCLSAAGVCAPGSFGFNGTPLIQQSGTGDADVAVPQPARGGSRYVRLTCSGAGVTLRSSSHGVDGDYTHTCFAGFVYVWAVKPSGLGQTLHIRASSSTTWTLMVVSAP